MARGPFNVALAVRDAAETISKNAKRLHLWHQPDGALPIAAFVMKDYVGNAEDASKIQWLMAESFHGRHMEMKITRRGMEADIVIKEHADTNPAGISIQGLPIDPANVDLFVEHHPKPVVAVVGAAVEKLASTKQLILVAGNEKQVVVQELMIVNDTTGPAGVLMN